VSTEATAPEAAVKLAQTAEEHELVFVCVMRLTLRRWTCSLLSLITRWHFTDALDEC